MSDPQIIRPRSCFLTYQAYKALQLVAQAKGCPMDELADTILRKWLEDYYPDVMTYLNARHKADKEFRDALAKKLQQVPF